VIEPESLLPGSTEPAASAGQLGPGSPCLPLTNQPARPRVAYELAADSRLSQLRDILARTDETHAISLLPASHVEDRGSEWWFALGARHYMLEEDASYLIAYGPGTSAIYAEDGRVRAVTVELDGGHGMNTLADAARRAPIPARPALN
jgi:hypothetical protein